MTRYARYILPVLITLSCLCADARIGDSRNSLERRITDGGRGLVLDDDLAGFYLQNRPFTALVLESTGGNYRVHRDLNVDVGVYYKVTGNDRAFESQLRQKNGQPVQSPDGWLLFVVYYKGSSVLEMYVRSGMTRAEVNGILALSQGSSNWVDGKLPEDKYPNEDYKPSMPHSWHRADGKLLANQSDQGLLIYHVDVDDLLNKAKQKREGEKAPESLVGF